LTALPTQAFTVSTSSSTKNSQRVKSASHSSVATNEKQLPFELLKKLDILLWINCILNFSQITKANFTLAQFWICEATK
jgi:hypothetical protein